MIFNIFSAKKEIGELTKSNTEWQSKYAVMEKDLKEAQDTIGNFMVEKETFNKQMETLKSEYEGKLSESKEEIETTKKSLNREVTKKLASIGVHEGVVTELTEELTPDNFSKNMAMDREFFAKNKNAILKMAGIDPEKWENAIHNNK